MYTDRPYMHLATFLLEYTITATAMFKNKGYSIKKSKIQKKTKNEKVIPQEK